MKICFWNSSLKCMVLDTTHNTLYLTDKPALLKSKLKKIVSREDMSVGDISLATIVSVRENGQVLVQFFNSIYARIPKAHLSLEHVPVKSYKNLFLWCYLFENSKHFVSFGNFLNKYFFKDFIKFRGICFEFSKMLLRTR